MMLSKWNGTHLSVIGSSHIRAGVICQDSSFYSCEKKYSIAIVCDGHGSEKHFRSAKGSRLAVEAGKKAINAFMKDEDSFDLKSDSMTQAGKKKRENLLTQLEKNIIYNWNVAVNDDLDKHPFEDEELVNLSDSSKGSVLRNAEIAYGSTFISIVLTDTYCFGIQLGDGDCVVIKKDGDVIAPIPEDERLLFNLTTSLCDQNAIADFRHFWIDEAIAGAIVTTDGVRNSFATNQHYLNFCKTVLKSFLKTEQAEADAELCRFLERLTAEGSGDDVSVATVFDMSLLQDVLDREKDNVRKYCTTEPSASKATDAACEPSETEEKSNIEPYASEVVEIPLTSTEESNEQINAFNEEGNRKKDICTR